MGYYVVFKNKKTGKYKAPFEDVDTPEKAYPKFGDRGSAFCYADERYEGRPDEKARFREMYEQYEVIKQR